MNHAAISAMLAAATLCAGAVVPASAQERSMRFLEPADGAVVTSPFKVRFEVTGMTVKPAGEPGEGVGHHHLLIERGSMAQGKTIPFDDDHIHYGNGQSEAMVTLKPGRYTLTAQFGGAFHHSYGPALSHTIQITVK